MVQSLYYGLDPVKLSIITQDLFVLHKSFERNC